MASAAKDRKYRFTFGPWNISTGADPFGPPARKEVAFAAKIREYKRLGFDGVQFHDDDAVEADLDQQATERAAVKMKKLLDSEGLFCEFVAPRLWEHPKTVDGGFTSNNPADRRYAIERARRSIDIANALDCHDLVLWLAREGTYIRESKDPMTAVGRILDAVNALLEYDRNVRILGEMKPNEPMDQAYLPTPGHFLGLVSRRRTLARRRPDRIRSFDPGRPRPFRRHGLRSLARQALERTPQRSKWLEIRSGQGIRLRRPAARVQHHLGPRTRRLQWLHRSRCQTHAHDQALRPDQAFGE